MVHYKSLYYLKHAMYAIGSVHLFNQVNHLDFSNIEQPIIEVAHLLVSLGVFYVAENSVVDPDKRIEGVYNNVQQLCYPTHESVDKAMEEKFFSDPFIVNLIDSPKYFTKLNPLRHSSCEYLVNSAVHLGKKVKSFFDRSIVDTITLSHGLRDGLGDYVNEDVEFSAGIKYANFMKILDSIFSTDIWSTSVSRFYVQSFLENKNKEHWYNNQINNFKALQFYM